MRENRTYGLMRGRAYPTRDAPLYSTSKSGGVAESAAAMVDDTSSHLPKMAGLFHCNGQDAVVPVVFLQRARCPVGCKAFPSANSTSCLNCRESHHFRVRSRSPTRFLSSGPTDCRRRFRFGGCIRPAPCGGCRSSGCSIRRRAPAGSRTSRDASARRAASRAIRC